MLQLWMENQNGRSRCRSDDHKNPINAAYAVMTKSPHVLMISNGAELFAKEQGLVMVEPAYFKTDFRWQQLQNALKDEK